MWEPVRGSLGASRRVLISASGLTEAA
jgi:hypothetical protein